jgi:rubrerythrin
MSNKQPPVFKIIDKGLKSAIGPVVDKFVRGHQRGTNTVKSVLGFYVCQKCNYSQVKPFGCCPHCREPRVGLYIKNK